eukprot:PITA_05736
MMDKTTNAPTYPNGYRRMVRNLHERRLSTWLETRPLRRNGQGNGANEDQKRSDWDLRVPVVLWAYRITCKKLTGQTPFWLVYGMEAVMPMEYIVPSLRVAVLTGMTDYEALEEWLMQLEELEEEGFLVAFHEQVQKQREKAWYNHHIRLCTFKRNDLVLLYDSKFEKFPGKFKMHWLGPYVVK